MANIALLIGNSTYRNLNDLACCHADVHAMNDLLRATEKFNKIFLFENQTAGDLGLSLRAALDESHEIGELFFYFTGHGAGIDKEFYYCATDFESNNPNQTGLSTAELHTLLRSANAELTVKVIDACNSGTLLIKAESDVIPARQEGFKNLIQISSCLTTQNSLAGEPLSLFTERFIAAALLKAEGPVYYTYIINALKDFFRTNDEQTPYFVTQYTGRETFVDTAKQLDTARLRFLPAPSSEPSQVVSVLETTIQEALARADAEMTTAAQISFFIDEFFDGLTEKVSALDLQALYTVAVVEHNDFLEPTTRQFIIDVLSKQDRLDNFVEATVTRKVKQNRWAMQMSGLLSGMLEDGQNVSYEYDLSLNYPMRIAQVRVTMTPVYRILRKLTFVVSCAPSLERCYIFEFATRHRLNSFVEYELEGAEIARRWFKLKWVDGHSGVQSQIASRVAETMQKEVELARKHLLPRTT